jgi:flavin reductase (DIM6/NTAB) family NADH-FMN oxidoreductase RutF
MTIHREHPFADPEGARDSVRQFRGRLAAGVTLWTAGAGADSAGLTVSSVLVALGEPGRLLALVDPLSDLAEAAQRTGRAAVCLLRRDEHALAEVFGGVAPAPGGRFRQAAFTETRWGPVLAEVGEGRSWAGIAITEAREVGWSLLLTGEVETVTLAPEATPLLHHRGRYHGLA